MVFNCTSPLILIFLKHNKSGLTGKRNFIQVYRTAFPMYIVIDVYKATWQQWWVLGSSATPFIHNCLDCNNCFSSHLQ